MAPKTLSLTPSPRISSVPRKRRKPTVTSTATSLRLLTAHLLQLTLSNFVYTSSLAPGPPNPKGTPAKCPLMVRWTRCGCQISWAENRNAQMGHKQKGHAEANTKMQAAHMMKPHMGAAAGGGRLHAKRGGHGRPAPCGPQANNRICPPRAIGAFATYCTFSLSGPTRPRPCSQGCTRRRRGSEWVTLQSHRRRLREATGRSPGRALRRRRDSE